jgi:hypothetical protein
VAFSPLALPVHDAAYGGNSLLDRGQTPTGPMPTLRARMIAFQSGGNGNWNRSKYEIFERSVVRCGNAVTSLSIELCAPCGMDAAAVPSKLGSSHRRMDRATITAP